MVKLQAATQLEPRFSIDQRRIMSALTNSVGLQLIYVSIELTGPLSIDIEVPAATLGNVPHARSHLAVVTREVVKLPPDGFDCICKSNVKKCRRSTRGV